MATVKTSLNRLNASQADPSRTALLRNKFAAVLKGKLRAIRAAINKLVVEEDAFGLSESSRNPFVGNLVANQRWKFNTDPQKVAAFLSWLQAQFDASLFQHAVLQEVEKAYWTKYVMEGYRKGAARAFDQLRKGAGLPKEKLDWYKGTKDEFLRSSFSQPESIEKVKLLAGRVFTDLKNFDQDMATKTSRVLTDGLVQGKNPRAIAADLTHVIDVGEHRAEVIARTEIIRAHAEGQLDAMERLGVEEVGVAVEWDTAGDGRVCPLCVPLQGAVFTIKEAHGLIPRHPQCRCAFVPANVGESKADQKRGPVQLAKARNDSIKAEIPPSSDKTLEDQKKLTSWPGADLKISGTRPKSVLDQPIGDVAAEVKAKQEAQAKAKAAEEAAKAAALAKQKAEEEAAAKAKAEAEAKARAEAEAKRKAEEQAKRLAEEARRKEEERRQEVIAREKAGELPNLTDIQKVKSLPGSTRPDLMKNTVTGKEWVMKSTGAGLSPDHLRSEALADRLYRAAGLDVPKSGIVTTAEGPVKLAEFLKDGQTLGDWQAGKTAAQKEAMYREIRKGFVMDSLLANHDVAGLGYDNILIVDGKPYRIDNGGALTFRAQGAPKRDFGKVVGELTSLRDPKVNQQTATIFGKMTEAEIDDQIKDLLKRKDKILGEVDDPSLRKTLEERFDYLENRIKPPPSALGSLPKTSEARAKARVAEPGILSDTAQRVAKARVNGVTIAGDRDHIEDTNILTWGEKDVDGKDVTRFQLKVTKAGSDKILSTLGEAGSEALRKSAVSGVSVPSYDPYWEALQAAAKTVATHAGDKNYNQSKLDTAKTVLDSIDLQLKTAEQLKSINNDKEKLLHYKSEIQKVLDAKEKGVSPPLVKQYVPGIPAPSPSSKGAGLNVDVAPLRYNTSKLENGRAVRQQDFNRGGYVNQLVIDLGDGVHAQFLPNNGQSHEQDGLAFQGNLELKITGAVSPETLRKGMEKLRTLGIETDPPTKEFNELLYLHRSVYLRNDHELVAYKNIFENPDLTDGEKVEKIKNWAGKRYGVDFKQGYYNPEGYTLNSYGDGYRYWNRWDLPPEKIREEMKGVTLQHWAGTTDLPGLIDALLQSGGEMTPTTQRVRKGVSVSATGGMSSSADIQTGGASYFFTRISSENSNRGQFVFKIDALSRQDAISYDGDRYGQVSAVKHRGSTISQYREFSSKNDNETIFKNGLSLLDDIQEIRTKGEEERQKVIESFRKNKVDFLPDGRKIEDVVKVRKGY